jgi:uncharacterized protein
MPRVMHFEIPVDQPDKVIAFYERVFGWSFTKWDGPVEYWLVGTGDESEAGINGGLLRRSDPNQPMVNTIDVTSVDDYVARISAAGGEICVPKMAIPGVGWLAYFKDVEGNIFGIMQGDESAA